MLPAMVLRATCVLLRIERVESDMATQVAHAQHSFHVIHAEWQPVRIETHDIIVD